MFKILILTTEGCEACDIAKCNVNAAIVQSSNIEITREVKDWHEMDKSFINANKIKDFPAVLYICDDIVVNKTIGTYPSIVYLRWINMYFKHKK